MCRPREGKGERDKAGGREKEKMREEGGEEREGEGIGWEIARMRKREKRRGQREGLREGETGTDR